MPHASSSELYNNDKKSKDWDKDAAVPQLDVDV